METIDTLDVAWAQRSHGVRLRSVLEGAQELRRSLASASPVSAVRTLPLATLAYPTRFAFQGAALSPAPLLSLTHRCVLVQFNEGGKTRTLLFNPTDVMAARRTPFFARMIETVGFAERVLSRTFDSLEDQLAALGVTSTDVDFVAFDHFHTQDIRGLLGTTDGRLRPRFPNARLLAPACEWNDWHALHPLQRAWYVEDGRQGVSMDNVVLTQNDLSLGEGVLLLRTPGHTSGNQTLFFKTERGVWGVSENGVCVDNWSPRSSGIAGLPSAARTLMLDVIMNTNTPECAADQLTSMMLERTLVDPIAAAPAFVQMYSSSEATPALFAPGLSPGYLHGELSFGQVRGTGTPRLSSSSRGESGFGAGTEHYR